MHPVLIRLGPVSIYSYSFLLAVSFIIGLWIARIRAKRTDLNQDVIVSASFFIVLTAMIGSRLYYVLFHLAEFKENPLGIFIPSSGGMGCSGGLTMYGGLIGGILAAYAFFKLKKLRFLPYADAFVPSVGIGIFLTRIGCFLNGCCFGLPTEAWYGVHFPPESPAGTYQLAVNAEKLIPSQLLLSAGGLFIAALAVILGRKKFFLGFQFYLLGVLYPLLRFAVDLTRYYPPHEKWGSLSHNQAACIVLFFFFSALMVKNLVLMKRKARREKSGSGLDN